MPTRDDTAKDGYGRGEVRATLGDSCYKSPVFRTRIEAALEDAAAVPMAQAAETEPVAMNVTTDGEAPKPTDEDKGEIYHVEGLDVVKLGRQGENLTQEVQIDVSAWTEDNIGRSHVPDCGGTPRRNRKLSAGDHPEREHPDMEAHSGGHR